MAGPAAQLDEAKRFAEIVAILQKHHLVQGLTPEKVRDIFVDLGPTFVKFGQILSMRSDILPKEYCAALETLRTDVTPMPLTEVEQPSHVSPTTGSIQYEEPSVFRRRA